MLHKGDKYRDYIRKIEIKPDETSILYCPICGRRLDENRNN